VSRKGIDCAKMDTSYGKHQKTLNRLAGIFQLILSSGQMCRSWAFLKYSFALV